MSNRLTIGIAIGSSIIFIIILFVIYFGWKSLLEENQKLRSEMVEFKKLTNTLIRSSTKWATKDDLNTNLKALLSKKDLKTLRNDMKTLDSRLHVVGKTIGKIRNKVAELQSSDNEGLDNKIVECDDGKIVDVYGYTKRAQIKNIKDANDAPVAEVKFNASQEKPWGYEVYERNHRLATIIGKKDSGQLTFHHKLEYSVPSVDPDKFYNIELTSSEYLQIPLKNRFFWLNPKLDINVFMGGRVHQFAYGFGKPNEIISLGLDVGMSLSSYGKTKVNSLFRMFRFGIGYNASRQGGHLSFAPIAFNIGNPLPLLTNLYFTPQVGIDTGGGITINLGVGTQF